jgi:hypothetical protein
MFSRFPINVVAALVLLFGCLSTGDQVVAAQAGGDNPAISEAARDDALRLIPYYLHGSTPKDCNTISTMSAAECTNLQLHLGYDFYMLSSIIDDDLQFLGSSWKGNLRAVFTRFNPELQAMAEESAALSQKNDPAFFVMRKAMKFDFLRREARFMISCLRGACSKIIDFSGKSASQWADVYEDMLNFEICLETHNKFDFFEKDKSGNFTDKKFYKSDRRFYNFRFRAVKGNVESCTPSAFTVENYARIIKITRWMRENTKF